MPFPIAPRSYPNKIILVQARGPGALGVRPGLGVGARPPDGTTSSVAVAPLQHQARFRRPPSTRVVSALPCGFRGLWHSRVRAAFRGEAGSHLV